MAKKRYVRHVVRDPQGRIVNNTVSSNTEEMRSVLVDNSYDCLQASIIAHDGWRHDFAVDEKEEEDDGENR